MLRGARPRKRRIGSVGAAFSRDRVPAAARGPADRDYEPPHHCQPRSGHAPTDRSPSKRRIA